MLLHALQLEITALSYGKGPRIAASMEGESGASADQLHPPTQDEQEKMARFWAQEEANAPRGWEEEEELDYAEISRRAAAERKGAELRQSKDSGWLLMCNRNMVPSQVHKLPLIQSHVGGTSEGWSDLGGVTHLEKLIFKGRSSVRVIISLWGVYKVPWFIER